MSKFRILCLALAIGLPLLAAGQDVRSREEKRAKLEKEIAQIDAQLRANASKSGNAQTNLTLLRKKIENRNALIAQSDLEIKSIQSDIAAKQAEVSVIQGRLDTLTLYYGNLVRNAYKNRDARVWYMYLLASENVGQAYRRLGYMRNMSGQMNTQARKISAAKAELERETARLETLRDEARRLRDARQQEVASLQAEEKSAQALVSQLLRDRKKYQNELAVKRRQVEALNREIERMIREATKPGTPAKGSAAKPKTEIDTRLDAEFSRNKGRLPWPVDGPVVDKFGQYNHSVYKQVQMPKNNGIGISVPAGTRVQAVFDGVVKNIGVVQGYGNCVLVQHGSYFTFYCKLKSLNVKTGDQVKTGQTLGSVDEINGESQCHFEIWKGTSAQNPELWLR